MRQVEKISRPYAFIKFDRFIQKTRKLYLDTRTQRNLEKLSEELSEVHSIMTRNIQEVLGQGERLESEYARARARARARWGIWGRVRRELSGGASDAWLTDVGVRGGRTADVSKMSSTLTEESKKYAKRAGQLSRQVRTPHFFPLPPDPAPAPRGFRPPSVPDPPPPEAAPPSRMRS